MKHPRRTVTHALRGVVVDVTDGQVTLLGDDGHHMRNFMSALVLEDPTEARRRMPTHTRST